MDSNRGSCLSKFLVLLIFLSSCFSGREEYIVQTPTPKRQKQKIALLQKKLKGAEKEQLKISSEIERISREISETEISLIRRQLDEYERRNNTSFSLFMEEREALYRMIQSGPSPEAFEAQVELDRILRLITEMSDEAKYTF